MITFKKSRICLYQTFNMISNLIYKNTKPSLLIILSSTLFLVSCIDKKTELPQKNRPNSLNVLELIEIEPKNNSKFVNRNAKIILKFNNQLDPSTIKSNAKNNSCS